MSALHDLTLAEAAAALRARRASAVELLQAQIARARAVQAGRRSTAAAAEGAGGVRRCGAAVHPVPRQGPGQ